MEGRFTERERERTSRLKIEINQRKCYGGKIHTKRERQRETHTHTIEDFAAQNRN